VVVATMVPERSRSAPPRTAVTGPAHGLMHLVLPIVAFPSSFKEFPWACTCVTLGNPAKVTSPMTTT
jgi:hypothetical protein